MEVFRPGTQVRLRPEWRQAQTDLPYTVVPCGCRRCARYGSAVLVVAPGSERRRHLTTSWLRRVGASYLRPV
jgi:hypothetical protein